MRVLVTGGAGYIGSHAAKRLLDSGHQVVVVDNLFRGHRQAVPPGAPFVQADLRDTSAIEKTLRQHDIECVMHFAALAYVGESVLQPLDYFENNAGGSASLLRAMDHVGVRKLVFSSTCATYGEPPPPEIPIAETCPQSPINPYGWSKLFVERMMRDYARSNDKFCFAALRYFNVAGCAVDGSLGEDHHPETHLIPVLLNVALGKLPGAVIFGDDYPTPDGTCIRDYLHVEDLADAHITVMESLNKGDQRFYNLGTGNGASVHQVVEAVRAVTGHPIPVEIGPRREGDPPMLYANPRKIKDELGWEAQRKDIKQMVADAWRWFEKHPNGY
ncbi:MAG: UDP-glucose 4-epimerase GalE [Phycisphaeraceae bacterium]|nr:UDP-glucose 4-epimerase GalE [Phycisphaeraceae bacterium]